MTYKKSTTAADEVPGFVQSDNKRSLTPEQERHIGEQALLPQSQHTIKINDNVVIIETGQSGTIFDHGINGNFVVKVILSKGSFMLKNFKAEEIKKI